MKPPYVQRTAYPGVRWDADLGEFVFRCASCRLRRHPSYWPLTSEFWDVGKGLSRCRACWNETRNRSVRVRYATDPVFKERERARQRANKARQRARRKDQVAA